MNTDPKLKPESLPRWVLPLTSQMPKEWFDLKKRTIMIGEREKIVTSKLCTKCKDEKPFSAFWVLKTGAHDSWCRACRNFVRRERIKSKRGGA
jgi:hypothetical protein